MAIHEHPRENLLLEATAYTRRCLYRVPLADSWMANNRLPRGKTATSSERLLREWLEPFQPRRAWELFVGVRADHRWSIYFDEQPVLQFNRLNRLRRVFAAGQRYAAHDGRLQRLVRSSPGGQVRLQPVDLDAANQQAVLAACQQFLEQAAFALSSGRAERVGMVPVDDQDWLPDFEQNLQAVATDLRIASSPAD